MSNVNKKVKIISHRGFTTDNVQENTIEAFEHAISLQADMIETDVREMQDGTLVCAHNPDWRGTKLRDMSYEKWKAETKAKEGWQPPRLSEVLRLCAGVIPINLEIKEKSLSKKVVKEVEQYPELNVIISSFNDQVVKEVKMINGDIATALVIGKSMLTPTLNKKLYWQDYSPEKRLENVKADAVCPHHRLVDEDFIQRLQNEGYDIFVWTVNSSARMKKVAQLGVNGIFTDQVPLAMKLLR
ncbi:glycerophosphodiester phosphodiesterase [Bacillus piscicola]|uniref:glycerophosphodiester phosphodiesterase n=1 Tax=Bacillus piscicola TaxID=1632684 RepID=UPI001F08DC0A|nr:glycerophosphodiester phosphodiesterase [Bacillus piscicola]